MSQQNSALLTAAPTSFATGYVDLDRRFGDLSDSDMDEVAERASSDHWHYEGSPSWDELLQSQRVVIFAEAGSGKTWDMRAQVARLSRDNRAAFFVPLEALNAEGLRDYLAMEPVSVARFDAWLSQPDEVAWIFLDAVDELKLTTGTLDRALGKVVRDVGLARSRLRVILSCRPTDWRPVEDKETFLSRLPLNDPTQNRPEDAPSDEDAFLAPLQQKQRKEEKPAEKEIPAFRMVVLLPLNGD
ncbi:MAG: hypothetical protein ABI240_17790, partial [Sphingomonas sp.]